MSAHRNMNEPIDWLIGNIHYERPEAKTLGSRMIQLVQRPRAGAGIITACLLLWISAGLAQDKGVDMDLLRRAGDTYWQAGRCSVEEPLLQRYLARTNELIKASPKTTSSNKMLDIWVEYQQHMMCRNQRPADCGLQPLAPEACTSFVAKFRRMRINQADWRLEEGLR